MCMSANNHMDVMQQSLLHYQQIILLIKIKLQIKFITAILLLYKTFFIHSHFAN